MEFRTVDSERQLGHTVVQKLDRAIKLAAVMANMCPFLVLFLGKQKNTRNEEEYIASNLSGDDNLFIEN
ncbi:hypothetical protein COR50_10205 [Chitinophaga caeni]|uniref:Uncharacterized protein n=1 Tax=Chitinophaga caeni TaxID=2029983 RepID=A0A291QU70_9BACT|nr:hypothetical protein COR50_10205 [Chitinophaga caeni]